MDNKLVVSLQPKQKEAFRKSLITPVTFFGGAKGGGKSYFIRGREIYRRMKYAGTRGVIIRKTLPELWDNHIYPILKEHPQLNNYFDKTKKIIHFPNGSTTSFSYLQNEQDVFTYQGREFEDISIDEATQHSYGTFTTLRSSNRTTNSTINPTMILTGNPGGIGHAWVKRLFIDKKYLENEKPEDYVFIQAFVQDNKKLLEADPEYINRLKALPPHLRKAYLDGDWNIHAGQALSELSYQTHVIEPFELPPSVSWFAGFDPGFNHPFSFLRGAVTNDGTLYVTNHVTGRLKTTDQVVNDFVSVLQNKQITIHAGHDLWYPGRGGGPAEIETYRELLNIKGYAQSPIVKANTAHIAGVAMMRKLITANNAEKKPHCFFFRNPGVVQAFNVIASLQFDPKNPEDILKMDADENGEGGDDAADAFRYLVMSRKPHIQKEPARPAQFSGQHLLDQLLEEE